MSTNANVWFRVACVLDAFSLLKLIGAAVLFVVFEGSPLFALGIVFAAPILAACSSLIIRLLRQAAAGGRLDQSFAREIQSSRKEPSESFFRGRERPRPRSLASSYVDVTPIKYRRVRSSAPRA